MCAHLLQFTLCSHLSSAHPTTNPGMAPKGSAFASLHEGTFVFFFDPLSVLHQVLINCHSILPNVLRSVFCKAGVKETGGSLAARHSSGCLEMTPWLLPSAGLGWDASRFQDLPDFGDLEFRELGRLWAAAGQPALHWKSTPVVLWCAHPPSQPPSYDSFDEWEAPMLNLYHQAVSLFRCLLSGE